VSFPSLSDLAQAFPEGAAAYRFMGDEYAVRWPGAEETELARLLEELRDQEGVAPFGFGIARGCLLQQTLRR
jgi:hypothetical protein